MIDRKSKVLALLSSLESGDRAAWDVIHPERYVQHNLNLADGRAAFEAWAAALPRGATRVNTVRVLQDGEHVVTHSEFTFAQGAFVSFDVFRFEGAHIVEHWDNQQAKPDHPSPSGHGMLDGPTEVRDHDKTAANKALLHAYMDDLISGRREKFPGYFNGNSYIQHNALVADNLTGLVAGLQALAERGLAVHYERVHRVLGEGDFVLVVAEGTFGEQRTSFYDFYRIEDGRIAEHWDTLEPIPPASAWNNANGKF